MVKKSERERERERTDTDSLRPPQKVEGNFFSRYKHVDQ